MPLKSRSHPIVGAAIALAGLMALLATVAWYDGDSVPSEEGTVRVAAAPVPPRASPTSVSQPYPSMTEVQTEDPQEFIATLIRRFPAIREANIVCEDECRLVAALGDQTLGPTPLDGGLERFLVEQGYELKGDLVIDEPGDNDILLTIPVRVPSRMGKRERRETG